MRPRLYFDTHVLKNFQVWGADPTNLEKARQAAIAADAMADRVYNYLHPVRPRAVGNSPTAGGYRRLLVDAEPDYQLVWDAARNIALLTVCVLPDLGRDNAARAQNSPQTPVVAATLRNGERRALRVAVARVVKMWENFLRDQKL